MKRLAAILPLLLVVLVACGVCDAVRDSHEFLLAYAYPVLDQAAEADPDLARIYAPAKKALESDYAALAVACADRRVSPALVVAVSLAIANMLDLYGGLRMLDAGGTRAPAVQGGPAPEWQRHRDRMLKVAAEAAKEDR
jgi:hypothetical protein